MRARAPCPSPASKSSRSCGRSRRTTASLLWTSPRRPLERRSARGCTTSSTPFGSRAWSSSSGIASRLCAMARWWQRGPRPTGTRRRWSRRCSVTWISSGRSPEALREATSCCEWKDSRSPALSRISLLRFDRGKFSVSRDWRVQAGPRSCARSPVSIVHPRGASLCGGRRCGGREQWLQH